MPSTELELRASLAAVVLVVVSSCSSGPQARVEGKGPVTYPLASAPSPGSETNFPVPPLDAEVVMRSCDLKAQFEWDAGAGVTGAHKVALYSQTLGKQFLAKWKEVPRGLESYNNSPRRELAAYELQKLFLDPADFVVPPSVMRCVPIDEYRLVIDKSAKPTVPGSNCVLGNLSLWMDNVDLPDPLYDEKRFATDANYAVHMADFNLFTYLIDHKDGRKGNFLVSEDNADRRVFAIDNGISFDAWIWNYFVQNWNSLRVPALRKQTVDRLREIKFEQLAALLTVAELQLAENGILESVTPGPTLNKRAGVRQAKGVIQFGLMSEEVDDLVEQIDELLRDVDDGKIPTF